jgi:hypothetical protein
LKVHSINSKAHENNKRKTKERANISSLMKNVTYYTLIFNNLYSFIKITRRNSLGYA